MTALNFQRIFIGLTALVMLVFALPRFIASLWMALGDPVYHDMELGKPISDEDRALLIESREAVLTLVDHPIAAGELAAAYVIGGLTPENMEKGIAYAKKSVEWSPLNAFSWNRLSSLLTVDPANHKEGVEAWMMARRLAEHEPYLLHPRIRIGIILYASMTEEERALLLTDLETAYRKSRGRLRQFGRDNNLLEWFKFLMRDQEKTKYFSS